MPHHTHKDRSYFPRDKKRDRDVNSKGGRHNNRRKHFLREKTRRVRYTAAKQINEGMQDYFDVLYSLYGGYDSSDYNCYDSNYDYVDETYYDYVNNHTVFNDVIGTKFVEEYVKTIAT